MAGVFANGLEISGKSVGAKTIAAMPDVCFTPPENPATPPGVPVPYPSFGVAGDTEAGTGTVFIGGETVNIKNKSDLSKTSGTEAGCAAKKGVVTSKNTGKAYFNSWSGDVKFDGEPVIRNTDLSTHNHASPGGNSPPWVHVAKAGTFPLDADEWPTCPCCKGPAHANQVDEHGKLYETTTENKHYQGIVDNRQAKIDSIETDIATDPPTLGTIYTKDPVRLQAVRDGCAKQKADAEAAKSKIDAARAKDPPCPNLHNPPDAGCGTHFKPTRSLNSLVPDTVVGKGQRKDYYREKILGFTDGPRNLSIASHTTPDGKPIRAKNEKVNHMTPLAAGGCPISQDNLMPTSALTKECQELDNAQTKLQDFGEKDW